MNGILGNVELLLDGSAGPLSADARACLGEVQIATRRLSRQVQILLLWSQLRASEANRDDATLDLIALIRDVGATGRTATLSIEPADARLIVRGQPFWLQALIGEIIELGAACERPHAPTIRLETRNDGSALSFAWPHFCVADAGPLQIALIEAIAQMQGATAVLTSNGLDLYWPAAQLPGAIGGLHGRICAVDAERTDAVGGNQSGERG